MIPMQHLLDLARPYAPLILALIVWPLVGAALSWWLWWDTPEHWEAYAKAHPGRALAIRALRTVSPHLRKLVVAWRDYASARSSLPPLGIALPAEKTGALVVSETRGFTSARSAYELDHPQPPHPTPADGIAHDAQRVALGAVTVDPAKGDGQRGSVDLPGLLTCLVAAILAGALCVGCPVVREVAMRAAPGVPDPVDCRPGVQRCDGLAPVVCSATGREWPALPRSASGEPRSCAPGVCVVSDGGVAHCALAADGGGL